MDMIPTTKESLTSILSQKLVLIVGDIILDHYLQGLADRISPEAPVPVVLVDKAYYRLGGAANVALNIKSMGATPILVSVTGQDDSSRQLTELLSNQNICADYILKDASRKTTCKTRVMSRHQQLLRYDVESTEELIAELQDNLYTKVEWILEHKPIDALILQDYNKGVLTAALIQKIIDLAAQKDVITLADPKHKNFLAYQSVDYFKPNLREIKAAFPNKIQADMPLEVALNTAAKALFEHTNCKNVLITLGEKGMYWQSQSGEKQMQKARVRNIADVCGAGDTVISLLALGLASSMDIRQCIELANIAGGQVCEQVGVVPIDKEQLFAEFFNATT